MRSLILIAALVGLVFISSISIVYSKHRTRQLFAELQVLQKQSDDLHMQWAQLLLEQGTWAAYTRIEKLSRESLNMQIPPPGEIQVINACH